MRQPCHTMLLITVGFALLSSTAGRRIQADDLETVVDQIADTVADELRKANPDGHPSVTVGSILSRKTGGPRTRKELLQALQERDIEISPKGGYVIKGQVEPRIERTRGSQSPGAVLDLQLSGPNTRRELKGIIDAEEDVIALLGVTGQLPVAKDQATSGFGAPVPGQGEAVAVNSDERKLKLAKLIYSPEPVQVTPNPTPVISDDGEPEFSEAHVGPFGLEVLIKDENGSVQFADGARYSPRPPRKTSDDKLFVDIQPGEIYAIRVINDATNYDVGVTLTIDGLNTFEFSDEEGYRKLGKWIIPAESAGVVRGWHLRNENGKMINAEFEVARYGEGLAEQMGALEDVGTITATFRAAWTPSQSTPNAMLAFAKPRGTRKGAEVESQLKEVKRSFGEIRASISIQYQIAE